jgi:hypothetical protein
LMQGVSTSVRNLTQQVDLLRTSQGGMGRLSDLVPSWTIPREPTEADLAAIQKKLDSFQAQLESWRSKEEKK